MSNLDQIRESIEAHLAELTTEITALEDARAALHANSAITARAADPLPKPRTRTQTKPSKAQKRVEVLLAGELEAMLREAEDGLSAIAISKRSNTGYGTVVELLRELESAGQVRRTGARRTSLWRLITDEQRIAERAAELESRRVAKSGSPPDRR
jgi:hypothetical protein